jgi:hypothetical protein
MPKVTPKTKSNTLDRMAQNVLSFDDISQDTQNASDNNEVTSTEQSERNGGTDKERMTRIHFGMLETYYRLPLHRKQKYILNESSREFLIFLQEICLNAMGKTFEFDKEELLSLNCENLYIKTISGLLTTRHLRNLLSSEKMVKAIDCLIPYTLKWRKSSFN